MSERNEDEEYWEFDESVFEEEDDEELQEAPPQRTWVRKVVSGLLAIVLLGNILAFWPTIYNGQTLQFLKVSAALYQNQDIRDYKQTVVSVSANGSKGTGFHIGDGFIVTNDHVVKNVAHPVVSFGGQDASYHTSVVKQLPEIDITILQLTQRDDGRALPPYLPLQTELPEKQDKIYLIGNPLSFFHIANQGVIYGEMQLSSWSEPVLMLDGPVFKGNSGSPVINEKGEAIAVVFATIEQGDKKYGLAVPVSYFSEAVEELQINVAN